MCKINKTKLEKNKIRYYTINFVQLQLSYIIEQDGNNWQYTQDKLSIFSTKNLKKWI